MIRKRIYIFVNGILTFPGAADNWTGKAVTWSILRQVFAEKVEYFSGAGPTRSLFQNARAKKLRHTLQRYLNGGWEIVLVGHSNGTDVILDALRDMDWPRVAELHLISAACAADFAANGLNEALRLERIGKVVVYCAGKDGALSLAHTFVGKLLGYGSLGKSGPVNVHPDLKREPARVVTVVEPEFGHSDWFNPEHFDGTLQKIVAV